MNMNVHVSACCLQQEWRYRAAQHIQAVYRGYCVRRDLKWQIYYATKIQRLFRSWSKRRALMLRVFTLAQRKRFKNVIIIQALSAWIEMKFCVCLYYRVLRSQFERGWCGNACGSMWSCVGRLRSVVCVRKRNTS